MKTKYKIGDIGYIKDNTSYLFDSIEEMDEEIKEVKIDSIQQIRNGIVSYLVDRGDGHYSYNEDQIYPNKEIVLNIVKKGNIRFIRSLLKSSEEDLENYERNIKNAKKRIKHYKQRLNTGGGIK